MTPTQSIPKTGRSSMIQISQPKTDEADWQALRPVIESGWLTQGPKVKAFEEAFAQRHQTSCALATTSCTTALHLILAALNIGPGDEVIVPSFTWIATANVVLYCGATPILVDIDPHTFNIDPRSVEKALSPKTKAILAVHLFGLCADVNALQAIAPSIPIIEDAACAVGSLYKGRSAGTLGLAGAFSFHPRKILTTGEGGMVTTNDLQLAETMNQLRNHGASISEEQRHKGPQPYLLPDFNLLGFNYRMTDLQGALGLSQLSKLDELLVERHQWADFYTTQLANIGWLRLPKVPAEDQHGWQSYVTWVDESVAPMSRNELMAKLQHAGISTRPGTHAIHMLGYYHNRFGYSAAQYPHSRDAALYSLALPLHNQMQPDDYAYIVETLQTLNKQG